METDRIQRLIDKSDIQDNLYRWSRGVARKNWDLIKSAFHPDAADAHGTFDGSVAQFVEWEKKHHVGIDQSAHLITNILVEFTGPTSALVESYVVCFQDCTADAHNARRDLLPESGAPGDGSFMVRIVGRYVDRFEKRNDSWKIAHRTALFESLRADFPGGRGLKPIWNIAYRDDNDPLIKAQKELGLEFKTA